jgi:hypothetical protein
MGTAACVAHGLRRSEVGIKGSWGRLVPPSGGAAIVAVPVARFGGHAGADADAGSVAEGGSLVQGCAAGGAIVAVTTACGAWHRPGHG